jgi:hypothetical protein
MPQSKTALGLPAVGGGFLIALFVCCMFCHGELAARKPAATNLTEYYLMLALGGVLGGFFVAVIAPAVFSSYLELPLGVVGTVLLSLTLLYGQTPRRLLRAAVMAAAVFLIASRIGSYQAGRRVRIRNFYGTLQVTETGGASSLRVLSNGPIHHGAQFLSPDKSRLPTTYYGPESGVGVAIRSLAARPIRVGVIGLGAGTVAAYGGPGDSYRFYDINPAVVQIANTEFRYLRECPCRTEVVTGDGRLALQSEPSQQFDVLALDAFTGDSIPTHLLTREAFDVYFSHVKPDGVVAVHVTNKYLELRPVVQAMAGSHRQVRQVTNAADRTRAIYASTWVLLTANEELLRKLAGFTAPVPPDPRFRMWTDDYSNLLQLLR